MDVSDDLPDLDDMSELVQTIKLNKQRNPQTLPRENASTEYSFKKISNDVEKILNYDKKKPKEFGGMKKGFLFGGGSRPTAQQKPATPKSKPTAPRDIISPKYSKETRKDPLVLDEVQDALKESENVDKSWVTNDLLKQVESNETLARQLSDPRIAKAISWMQKDPKGAMEYYKNDAEIQTFFKDFYAILGKHFTDIGAKQDIPPPISNASPEDEKAMQNIISNPEIRQILVKPDIQKLIELLRKDPEEAQAHMNSSNAAFRADVNKLVSAGVLAFQSH